LYCSDRDTHSVLTLFAIATLLSQLNSDLPPLTPHPSPLTYNVPMLWVSQFGIVSRQAQEHTPWIGLFPEDVRSSDSSDVYLVVAPATAGSVEFAAELKEAVGTMFHKSKVSLTGGLLRALQAAHEHLREWNRRSMRDHWVAAGISCAGVRGQEVYLAQVAPASAAFSRNGDVTALRPSLADAAEPLGLFDEFWPEFSRFEMEPGDRLLLLTPALAEALPAEEPAASLALSPDQILPSLYRHARSIPDCGAVLIAALDGPEQAEPGEA
jgi:hypothetical protein